MLTDAEVALLEKLEILVFAMRHSPIDLAIEIAKRMEAILDSALGPLPSD